MDRSKMLYLAAVIMIVLTAVVFAVFAKSPLETANKEFLAGFGWQVGEEKIESVPIIIPKEFDNVYQQYNELQLMSGLDLRPYAGMNGVRYTYDVLNFPGKENEDIRANVICIQSKPVGGDIMSTSLNGFMVELDYLNRRK